MIDAQLNGNDVKLLVISTEKPRRQERVESLALDLQSLPKHTSLLFLWRKNYKYHNLVVISFLKLKVFHFYFEFFGAFPSFSNYVGY